MNSQWGCRTNEIPMCDVALPHELPLCTLCRFIFAGHPGKTTLLPGTPVHGGYHANWLFYLAIDRLPNDQ